MEKIAVAQKAVILNKDEKFLALQRSAAMPVGPHTWDLPGGDLEFGEDARRGILREIKEETNLEVEHLQPFDVEAHVTENGEFWVTIAYKARVASDEIMLSVEHDEFRWVSREEFLQLDSSKKLRRFVMNLN